MMLNKCVNPEDEEGPGDILEIQHNLQITLLEYVRCFKLFLIKNSLLYYLII